MIKEEQDTWLPGIEPELDWDLIPIESIWDISEGLSFKILEHDKKKMIVTVLRMVRDACGYVPAMHATPQEFSASEVIRKVSNFKRTT
jgi:hypothetical protein